MDFKGKYVLILGLGRSGIAAARALAKHGARITLTDARSAVEIGALAGEADKEGLDLSLGGHPESLLKGCELIVLSPGVPGTLAVLRQARQEKIEIWSEIELAYRLARRHWVAVTGTNGKTTTTSLLAAMWEESGKPYFCGGNIGHALADQVEALEAEASVIAEVSSFQLEEIHEFRPEVAVMTNLTPDHLDRYPGMDSYRAAKARIFENQGPSDVLVFNAMDPELVQMSRTARSRKMCFSREQAQEEGAWIEKEEILIRRDGGKPQVLMPLSRVKLRGPHNHENAMAAALAAAAGGLSLEVIASALESFSGVEHRLEFCGDVAGVRFINDSKATNVDSVEKALQSFNEPVHLILGGRDKEGDFTRLSPLILGHVSRLYVLGEAADKIERQVGSLKPLERVASLEEAVSLGLKHAKRGEWILLSPGCASFDMFENYEHRGRVFKAAVAALGKTVGA